jgi:hypothetical protein
VAVGFAAGLNVYATTAVLGLLGRTDLLVLPGSLGAIESWWVIGVCLALWAVEFIADKIPAFDVVWNLGSSLVRIPVAGVIGYAGAADLEPGMQVLASAAGAVLAALAASGKAATHASVAPSPEPFSNIAVSLLEDGLVIFMLWLSATHPVIFGVVLVVSIVLAVILLVVLIQFLRVVLRGLSEFFKGRPLPRELG